MEAYILPVYTALVSAVVGYLIARVRQMRTTAAAEHEALGALLRNDMYAIYETYRDADEVPVSVQDEIDSLYQAYHGLGFNHTGTKIYNDIMEKKTKI